MARPPYLPTPADIRLACQRIQATWTDDERRKRLVQTPRDVTTGRIIGFGVEVPTVDSPKIVATADDE